MRLGILGGSFDPVHHGHLILARAAREELELDRVIFVPANISPHKTGAIPTSSVNRLEMLKLALAGEDRFDLEDFELGRPAPSYTIETLRHLQGVHPGAELVLLIGSDNVEKFPTWHESEKIPQLARLAVLERRADALSHAWPVVRRLIDISSTEIRQRVARGQSIRYLTPEAVCDYIFKKGLYRYA